MTSGGRTNRGVGGGAVAPPGKKIILYKHSHVVYQIEGYEEKYTVVQKFCPAGACLEVTRGQKVGFWVLFFIVTQLLLGFFS